MYSVSVMGKQGFELGFSFAKLLRNFCWTKRTLFERNVHFLSEKYYFVQLSAKLISHEISFYRICETLFCAIPLFRNVHIINDSFSWKWKSASYSPCFLGLADVGLFISNLYWLKILLWWFLFSRRSA